MRKMKLFFNALTKFICGILLAGLLVFLPAGSLKYSNGWLFLIVMFIPIFIMGIVLFIKSPKLLKKRLDTKEKEKTQKGIVACSGILFLLGFILSGLDFRFGWSFVPKAVTVTAVFTFISGYILYAEVMRENAYLSRIIEVEENQKVIDSGLYGIIRHPMYAATILMFLSVPLILGSWWAVICFGVYPVLICMRLKNEEEILTEQLEGYVEYKQKVKYRLIPFIW